MEIVYIFITQNGNMWLLSTWNVACVIEECHFQLYEIVVNLNVS